MNEEQKEENVPPPVLLKNNNQDNAPINLWRKHELEDKFLSLSSWKIALLGIVAQGVLALLFTVGLFLKVFTMHSPQGDSGLALLIIPLFFIPFILAIIIFSFISIEKTRKFGAVLSIIFSVVSAGSIFFLILLYSINLLLFLIGILAIYYFNINKQYIVFIILISILPFSTVFYFIGMHYFWKKA